MNMRKALILAMVLIIVSGFSALVLMFGSSWSVNAKAENEAWLVVNVSELEPGSATEIVPFWVYHRTEEETKNGEEPFLFVWGYAPHRGCPIKFVKAHTASYEVPARDAYASINHYIERCDGGIFRTNGEYMQGTGHPEETNMLVPKVELRSKGEYRVYRGRV